MSINETVLEMHFHRPLMDLFRDVLGLGPQGAISFFKFSPQKECFVGFDQAWIMTDDDDDTLFEDLKSTASGKQSTTKYVGYLLQFKVMKRVQRRSTKYPSPVGVPCGRIEIRNKANGRTGMSQHETLYKLAHNKGLMAYYACPSIFDKSELYKAPADLSKLHFVDVSTSNSSFSDNLTHHIFFEDSTMSPTWCSEAVSAERFAASDVANRISDRISGYEPEDGRQLAEAIKLLRQARKSTARTDLDGTIESADALQALTVIRVTEPTPGYPG